MLEHDPEKWTPVFRIVLKQDAKSGMPRAGCQERDAKSGLTNRRKVIPLLSRSRLPPRGRFLDRLQRRWRIGLVCAQAEASDVLRNDQGRDRAVAQASPK
jgi:hypothetical protein